jgi:hypothetical protein
MTMSRRQFAQLIATGALSVALPGVASAEDADRFTRSLEQPRASTARYSVTSARR